MKNTLLSKTAIPVLVLYMLVSLPACGDKSLDTGDSDQPNAFRIPRLDEPSHFDATEEYMGVVSDNKHSFQLFDLQGNVVFSEHLDPGGFFMVQMRDYDGFFILGRTDRKGSEMYAAYDYSGQQLLDMWCRALLRAFPSGQYYFTENDNTLMESSPGKPTIYDSQGNMLAEFSITTDSWEMTAVNDSLLVLEHYDRVQLISVPDMSIISDIAVNGVRPAGASMKRSLSSDGTHYAYLTAKHIVVCDLYNESVALVPLDTFDDIPISPAIFLSPNGDYLLIHHNPLRTQTIDVLAKDGERYVKTVDDFTIPMEAGYIPPVGGTFVSEHIFAASFASWGSNGLQPRTFLYRFDTAEAVASGLALEGFIWINPQSPERINRLTIDSEAGTASISEFNLGDM
ncbi:MAG: hypothetical protein OEV49_12730 [candidate division Zixibacteria bacterium]|nr:hypothetical protein [candidate division Zixibacteria bacterium]MDH3937815.1 hypothetical protein [candidate division Zixibacteria bacterium]MDH4033116.1 hypothetical protein [candidate division Zixibacteria bacterium]